MLRGKSPRFYDRVNGKHAGVVYVFWNTHTNERYTGKTETAFRGRLYSHNSCIKNEIYDADFYKEVRANPSHFRLGVLELLDLDAQDSSEREVFHVANLKRLGFRVYNCNKGGGGGYAIQEKRVFDPKFESPSKLHNLSPGRDRMKTTPQKLYPFQSPGGTKGFKPTPRGKKKRRVVYAIVDEGRGTDSLPRTKYYGRTARKLIERSTEHSSRARSVTPEDKEEKELYKEMDSRPEDFSIGILYEQHTHDPPLRDLEAYAQRKARERGEKLYNSDRGGGGGTVHPSKRRRRET